MLLENDSEQLFKESHYAQERYMKHLRNEIGRAEAQIPSDLERYLHTGVCLD